MARMTGGQALVKSLYMEGVRVIFGLPGVNHDHTLQALYEEPRIRFITVRHEQATTYMADGFTRSGGGTGTAMVVPGPGLLNAAAGIGTAYSLSSPILVLSGQMNRSEIGANRGALHEINEQLDVLRPITKWAHRAMNPADVPEAVHQAFYHLKTGRPRPVEIEVPMDTMGEEAEVELIEPGNFQRPAASQESIAEAARILSQASSPLIWAGGGTILGGASEAVQQLAEYLQAPVISTTEARGVISDRHPLSLGTFRLRNDPLADDNTRFDVVLAVGTRFLGGPGGTTVLKRQQVIQIDIDPEEAGRNYENTFPVIGDARRTLEELHRVISSTTPAHPERPELMQALRARREETAPKLEPQGALTAAVRAAMPEDSILVSGYTQVGYYSRSNFPVYHPGSYMTAGYFGALGFAYPTALGAKVAQPNKPVVALSGDGGFLYNSQELATAVRYGINAVVVVFNDGAFGNTLRPQLTRFEGKVLGTQLTNPDFVKLAEAYGARGVRAESPERLESALREAIGIDAPTVIEVPVGPMPAPF